jgi:type IV pilus assembly protein PilM
LAIAGIDIGSSGIRAVRMIMKNGQLELTAAAGNELKPEPPRKRWSSKRNKDGQDEPKDQDTGHDDHKGVNQESPQEGHKDYDSKRTTAINIETSPEVLREMRINLASVLRQGPFRGVNAVLSLHGSSGLTRYLHMPLVPPWKMEMVMKYEVEEQGGNQGAAAFDYRILDLPDVGGQVTVMLSLIQEERLLGLMKMARQAGVRKADFDLSALGLFNAYVFGHGCEPGTTMIVNVGANTLDVIVVRDGVLCFARSVQGGGSGFTAAMATACGISFEEAEKLKREKGALLTPEEAKAKKLPEVEKQMSEAFSRQIGIMGGVLDGTLIYCRAQTKLADLKPNKLLVTGGGSMLKGFEMALARRMRINVDRLEPFRNISLGGLNNQQADTMAIDAPRYAVALGLAASRLAPNSFSMSLVPADIKVKRQFRDTTVWMWAGVACLVFAAGVSIASTVLKASVLGGRYAENESLFEVAKKERSVFMMLRSKTLQKMREAEELKERVYSGRDIVQVFSLLRKSTGGKTPGDRFNNIVLGEMGNRPPQLIKPNAKECKQSFQESRRVFVSGSASAKVRGGNSRANQAKAARQAVLLIKSYIDELTKQGKKLRIIDEVIDRYVDAPAQKLLEEKGIARREFVLELVLSSPEVTLSSSGGASR